MNTIAFLVNGNEQSAMGHRARAFAVHLGGKYRIRIAYYSGSKVASIWTFLLFLKSNKPDITYVFDMSYAGVIAAFLYKYLTGMPMLIETGDVIYELVKSTGSRGFIGLQLTYLLELFSLRVADRVVVRGSTHQKWLEKQGITSDVIQDGVDTNVFAPLEVEQLRLQNGLNGFLTIGIVGSSIWSDKLQMCYGWEVVETLRLLNDLPVKGIIIGGGSGIRRLKSLCRQYEIEDKVLFLGYMPYEELPRYLNLIDVCLSTQTNNLVGQVRTTGKLPLYLASGRYILASKVGEAALILEDKMLVRYDGVKDVEYPRRLASIVKMILANGESDLISSKNIQLAKSKFEYTVLAGKMAHLFDNILQGKDSIEEGSQPAPTL